MPFVCHFCDFNLFRCRSSINTRPRWIATASNPLFPAEIKDKLFFMWKHVEAVSFVLLNLTTVAEKLSFLGTCIINIVYIKDTYIKRVNILIRRTQEYFETGISTETKEV